MITPHDIPKVGHDLFRRGGGVGYDGHKSLMELARQGPLNAGAIAETVHRRRDAVRRALNTLASVGLVARDPCGTWSITGTHWDEAARQLGTHGKGERQRQRHAREQQMRSEAVEEWRRAHGGDACTVESTNSPAPIDRASRP